MNAFIQQIINLFSSSPTPVTQECREDLYEVVAIYAVESFDRQVPATLSLENLSSRDKLELTVYDGVDEDATPSLFYNSSETDSWSAFANEYNDFDKSDPLKIKIRISKGTQSRRRSIYDKDLFFNWIKQLSFVELLNVFEDLVSEERFIFECQEVFASIITPRFAFVHRGDEPRHVETFDSTAIIERAKYISCNDIIKSKLIPTDLYAESQQGCPEYLNLLNRFSFVYTVCFLFDYVKIQDGNMYYKLNGFKTLASNIDISNVESTPIDCNSLKRYVEIFKWLYVSGNVNDKAVIARNIVSLNIEDPKTLKISDKTLDAIDSNYRIYEKENVKQYITIRNDVSLQLHKYQKDIIGIVDGFESDFKKLLFTFLTFVFTTALIRVLAKNVTGTVLIPDTIIYLMMAYCILSIFYYCYARWELEKKIRLFDEQYNKTRCFYRELLSEKELNELFVDEKNNDGTYQAFQSERRVKFNKVWFWSSIIVILVLLVILVFNHWDALASIKIKLDDLYRIYQDSKRCCPHRG